MRNVYFGTSGFAATVLEALLDSPHAPALVVTRPARPKGRGKKLSDPPVAVLAKERALAVHQPESVNEPAGFEPILAAAPEAITVCAFGAIVKEPLLSSAPSFNVHPSLLPRWRGAAPIERAIAAGDTQTGVTIMRLVEELDAGPMCAQERVPIGENDDYGSISARLAELGGKMLVDALTAAQAGGLEWRDQLDGASETDITYAEKIVREDRQLDPRSQTAEQLTHKIRALNPHIGASLATASGDPLRVRRARVSHEAVAPGEVLTSDGRLIVGTTELALELLEVQPAGGKAMDVESFLRGNEAPKLN